MIFVPIWISLFVLVLVASALAPFCRKIADGIMIILCSRPECQTTAGCRCITRLPAGTLLTTAFTTPVASCGECHLKPGEVCDICGRREVGPLRPAGLPGVDPLFGK
jgi:hypothetical protein